MAVTVDTPGTGSSAIAFALSEQLVFLGQDDALDGDFARDSITDGPTGGTITFRAIIQEDFSDTFASGDNSVDMGDDLTNDVTIQGRVNEPLGQLVEDTSTASVTIDGPSPSKTIYAIDGDTNFDLATVAPGQEVTYRVSLTLPTGDTENLVITDFLPLPVFEAGEIMSGIGVIGASTGTPPPAGQIAFGSNHSLPGDGTLRDDADDPWLAADNINVIVDTLGNTVSFDFGSFDDPVAGGPYEIDILFTVTATDEPFADGLSLTNQAQSAYGTTDSRSVTSTEIVQITVTQPDISLTKGIVNTDSPDEVFSTDVGPSGVSFAEAGTTSSPFTGSITSDGLTESPIIADVAGIDGGDIVRFAIVVENTGRADAFDVLVRDTLASGFIIPPNPSDLNLRVHTGDGTELSFASASGSVVSAADAASYFFDNVAGTGDNAGVRIIDPEELSAGAGGAIDRGTNPVSDAVNTSGSNIVIITYDLVVHSSAVAASTIVNGAELLEFGANDGGKDFTDGADGPWADSAEATLDVPTLEKRVVSTSIDHAGNELLEAVIGEVVTYEIVVGVPEGTTSGITLTDSLDSGLAYIGLQSIVPSNSSITSSRGDFSNLNAFENSVTDSGRMVEFDFADLVNLDTDNDVQETLTLTFTAIVLNVPDNQDTPETSLGNRVTLTADNSISIEADSERVIVVEPALEVTKDVVIDGAGTSGDAGDPVVYTITIGHTGPNQPDAFDVSLTDLIPPEVLAPTVSSVTSTLGTISAADFEITAGGVLQVVGGGTIDILTGDAVTIEVTGTLTLDTSPGTIIDNQVDIDWSSIDGDATDSPHVTGTDRERDGSGGIDDYNASATAEFQVDDPGLNKSIVATSQDHTGVVGPAERVVVGEIVRYRLEIQLPESTMLDLQIRDRLPSGLRFIDDGTATIAFVSDGGRYLGGYAT